MPFEAFVQKPTAQIRLGNPKIGHDLAQFDVDLINLVFTLKPQPRMLASAESIQILPLFGFDPFDLPPALADIRGKRFENGSGFFVDQSLAVRDLALRSNPPLLSDTQGRALLLVGNRLQGEARVLP